VVGTNALPQNLSVFRFIEFWEGFGITIKSVVHTAPLSATAAVPARNTQRFKDTPVYM
jgi:hypothetical protein